MPRAGARPVSSLPLAVATCPHLPPKTAPACRPKRGLAAAAAATTATASTRAAGARSSAADTPPAYTARRPLASTPRARPARRRWLTARAPLTAVPPPEFGRLSSSTQSL